MSEVAKEQTVEVGEEPNFFKGQNTPEFLLSKALIEKYGTDKQEFFDALSSHQQKFIDQEDLPDKLRSLNPYENLFVLSVLPEYKYRHNLTPDAVTELLENTFRHHPLDESVSEKQRDSNKTFYSFAFHNAMFDDQFDRKDTTKQSLSEKSLYAMQALYSKYPKEVEESWKRVIQNPAYARPQHFLKVMKEVIADPATSQPLGDSSMYELAYLFNTFASTYYKVIHDSVHASSDEKFHEQVKWIGLLNKVSLASHMGQNEEYPAGHAMIKEVLNDFRNDPESNYFIKAYIGRFERPGFVNRSFDCSAYVDSNEKVIIQERVEAASEITIKHKEKDLSFSELKTIVPVEREHLAAHILSERYYGLYNKDGQMVCAVDQDSHEIVELDKLVFTIPESDVLTQDDRDLRSKQRLDFQILADPIFREEVKRYFDVDLTQMNIRTQMWFMEFVKNKNDEEFVKVKKFVDEYGSDGLKAFISLEYEEKNGDKILDSARTLTEQKNQVVVHELFHEYAQLLDRISKIKDILDKNLDDPSEGSHKLFIKQLEEALVRRTADLMLAMHHVAHEKSVFETNDVITSIKGVRTLFEIIEGLDTKESEMIQETAQKINKDSETSFNYPFLIDHTDGFQYRLRVFIRPYNSYQGQARMLFSLSFVGNGIGRENTELSKAFKSTTEFQKMNKFGQTSRESSELVVRIDNDPEQGVSLDMGRARLTGGKTIKARTGDKLVH